MKKFLTISALLLNISVFAQKTAITETGDEVLLFDNGTWKLKNVKEAWTVKLDTSKFTKSQDASFLLKGNKVEYGIYLNPKQWKFKKNDQISSESPSEYTFNMIDEDAYGMIIPERVQIPLNELQEVAIANALKAAPDAKIIKEEIREVNGKIVKHLQINGTIRGIKFSYLGYYYSSEKGSIQFLTYTSQNMVEKYRSQLEGLLNGLVEL